MRALELEVVDAVWEAIQPRIPVPPDTHPLGCHRPRVPDRLCFIGILIRLVSGDSWVNVESTMKLLGHQVSDTTLRQRRDEWVAAGVFGQLVEEAIEAYDRIIGLELEDVALDGSVHKAPGGGEGTGPNPVDRSKTGWKWSLLTESEGIPVGWVAGPANRHDFVFFEDTLIAAAHRGLALDMECLHLDRGYDYDIVRTLCREWDLEPEISRRNRPGEGRGERRRPMGRRWPVERTNAWLSNFGQLRRNRDRRHAHRLAQFALAVALLITAKLIAWRDRWNP